MRRLRTRQALAALIALTMAASAAGAQDSLPLAFPFTPKTQPKLDSDVRVRWLQSNAVRVRSIDPTVDDFSDLEPLRRAIGQASVVMLGEGSHGDGATFLAKTRLIKFLHERMDFDLLVFESGIFDVAKAWQMIRQNEDARVAFGRSVFFLADLKEGLPLIEYVGARAKTSRPLEIAGMDPQLTGTASGEFLAVDLAMYLTRVGAPTTALDVGGVLRGGIDSMSTIAAGRRVAPEPAFLDTLSAVTRAVRLKASGRDVDAAFWLRVLDGLRSEAYDWRQAAVAATPAERRYAGERSFLGRDAQQGQNIIWHALGRGNPRKVIVWSHIAHAEYRDPSPTVQPWERHWRSAGTVAREILGEQVYVIGFTAYAGISHNPVMGNPKGWPVRVPIKQTADAVEFEDLMHATGWPFGFVDFRRPSPGGEWLREPMWARPLNTPILAKWAEAVDGLVYLQQMTPLTKAPQ